MLASPLLVRLLPKSSLLLYSDAIVIIARDGRLCDSGALGSGGLSFSLKYKNFVSLLKFCCVKLFVDENIS